MSSIAGGQLTEVPEDPIDRTIAVAVGTEPLRGSDLEHRKFRRHPYATTLAVLPVGAAPRRLVAVRTLEVGAAGFSGVGAVRLEPGTTCVVILTEPAGRPRAASAVVTHATATDGAWACGFRFTDTPAATSVAALDTPSLNRAAASGR